MIPKIFKRMKLLLTVFYMFIVSFAISQIEWKAVSPRPTHQSLYDVQFVSKDVGWAAGGGGLILKTIDGGQNWVSQYSNGSFFVTNMYFIDENVGWAVGGNKIMKTTNGGENWEIENVDQYIGLTSIYFLNEDIGWAVGSYNRVYKTVNSGESWECIESGGFSGTWPEDVFFTDQDHGIIVGHISDLDFTGYAAVTEDGGDTWVETSPSNVDNITNIQMLDSDVGYALSGEVLLKTNDGGYTWQQKFDHTFSIDDLFFLDSLEGYILASYELYRTTDGGDSWSLVFSDYNASLIAFCMVDTVSYFVGFYGDMFKSLAPYNSLQRIGSERVGHFYGIEFTDSINGYARVFNRKNLKIELYKTNDAGKNWNKLNIPTNNNIMKFTSQSESSVFAIDDSEIFYMSNNGGEDWESVNLNITNSIFSICFHNNQVGYIGCSNGLILKTINGGLKWDNLQSNSNFSFRSIQCFGPENLWVKNGNTSVLHSIDGGYTWEEFFFDNEVVQVYFVNETLGFVYSNHDSYGSLYRTEDGGNSWEEVFNYYPLNNLKIEFASLDYGWLILGSKYYTLDKGKTWNEFTGSFSYPFINDVDFVNEEHGWVGGAYSLIVKHNKTNTSINEKKFHSVMAYPNPTSDYLNISIPEFNRNELTLNIYNLLGKKIYSFDIENDNEIKLNTGFLEKGVYLFEVKNQERSKVLKIVKN